MMAGPRIGFSNVVVDYPTEHGTMRAVDDVSLEIDRNEFVSLIGPSGCGKTTLLNCVAGFVTPVSGQVLVDGRPVRGPGSDRGVMFQNYGVFPWLTVTENVEFGLRLKANAVAAGKRREIVERYLKLMGLEDFHAAYPKMLSGGMLQRLALARTYAVHPEFLLMDEPFGALDAQTRTAMQELLLNVLHAEGKTVMLITHSVEEALYLSSKVVVISARPAQVRRVVDVPFSYPRDLSIQKSPEFIDLHAELRDMVMREYAAQEQLRRAS